MSFEDKRKQLFDCLSSAEESIKGTSLDQTNNTTPLIQKNHQSNRLNKKPPPSTRQFHGKDSIFKKPAAPIEHCLKPRRTPDYKVIFIYFKIKHFFVSKIYMSPYDI